MKHRRFRAHAMAGAFTQSGLFAYLSSAALIFTDGYGASAWEVGALFAGSASCYILGSQLNRRMLSVYSPSTLLHRGLRAHASAACLLVLVSLTGWGGMAAAMIGVGLGLAAMGVSSPNAIALALGPVRGRAGTASSMMGMLQFTTAALAGIAIATVSTTSLLPLGLAWAAAALLARLSLNTVRSDHGRLTGSSHRLS